MELFQVLVLVRPFCRLLVKGQDVDEYLRVRLPVLLRDTALVD
jgi:hypothetical protein